MHLALALFAAWVAPAASPQDPKIEEILTLMEKRTEGLKDVSFIIEQKADRSMGMPVRSEAVVSYVRGTGLRVRASADSSPDVPINFMPERFDVIYSTDALYIIEEFGAGGGVQAPIPGLALPEMPLSVQAYRIRYDDPAARSHDLHLLPLGFPVRIMYDEPFADYMIAPRLFFGREPNLTYGGLKPHADKQCHVLVSVPSPDTARGQVSFWLETARKEFYVDPASGALLEIRWELVAHSPAGMGRSEEKITFVTEATGSQKVTDALSIPESVKWSVYQGRAGRGRDNTQQMIRGLRSLRVNGGLAPEAILSPAEKGDLYAEAILRPAADYEARVSKDPKDAEALYSFAHAKSVVDPMSMMRRAGQGEKPDHAPVARALEKAREFHPASETILLNLLSAYKAAGEDKAEKDLLDRVVRGEVKGDRLRMRAAARLNAAGDFVRAAGVLESISPSVEAERRRVVLERIYCQAGAGNADALSRLFAEEAARRTDSADKAAFVDALESRLRSLPETAQGRLTPAKLLEVADQKLRESPGDRAFLFAKAALLRSEGKSVDAAIDLLSAAPEDEVAVSRAMQALFPSREQSGVRGPQRPEAPKEWAPEESGRLASALAKVTSGDPAVKLAIGRALAISGKEGDARRALSSALEACRIETRGKPHHASALRTAFLLGAEKGPDDWREQCVEVILTIGQDSPSLPYELIYADSNPLKALSAEYLSRKDWLRFYQLASRGNRIFKNWYWLQSGDALPKEAFEAIRASVLKEADASKYVELADFLESQHGEGRGDIAEVLEKAAAKLPDDLDLASRLASTYAQAGSRDRAVTVLEALIPRLKGEKQVGAKVDLLEVVAKGDPDKARKVLASLDMTALSGDHAQKVIDLCGELKDWDRGLEACRRAAALGLAPHLQMGLFYEKKEDYFEALRCYNRDRAEMAKNDPEGQMRKMQQQMRARRARAENPEEKPPESGEEARTRLLKKLGPDYLVAKFLQQKFEELPEPDEKSVKNAVERLSSDDSRERDQAYDALKKIGPRATPLLRPLLEGTEPEVKARVHQLLAEWAEPK